MSEVVVTMEDEYRLEELYAKFNLIPCLREQVAPLHLDSFEEDLVIQLLIHKRATIQTMVGLLNTGDIQDTSDRIAMCVRKGLVAWDPDTERLITLVQVSDELQKQLDLYQYPLPMLVPPRSLEGNKDSGYYTHSSSVILRGNHHDNDVCLDHLNRMNSIALSINPNAFTYVNKWKKMDKEQTRKAFVHFNVATQQVMHFMVEANNHFYLTHKYDKRGRTYACGYHISTQGNDYQKSCIEFAHKELVP